MKKILIPRPRSSPAFFPPLLRGLLVGTRRRPQHARCEDRRPGDIADNKATVTAALEKRNFYGAKIVTGVRVSTLTLDYTREIPLIKYVEANGMAVELPFTTQLTDLIFEQDYFCAVIVYDRTGRACHSAYLTFTAEGDPEESATTIRPETSKTTRSKNPKTSKRYEKATL